MSKKFLKPLLASLFLLATSIVFAHYWEIPDNTKTLDGGKKYEKEWKEVEALENKGLYKSALETVEKIYTETKAQNNHEQLIKALIFRLKYKNQIGDTEFTDLILDVENEVKTIPFPAKNIVHSILAEMYWGYYSNNQHKFHNRSETVNFNEKDIKTWNLKKIVQKTIANYELSLKKKENLQGIDIKTFNDILVKGSRQGIRPTLYDFLAHRAIDFYKDTRATLTRPSDRFELKDEFYLYDANEFVRGKIKSNDKLSFHYQGIKIFHDLLKFRLEKSNNKYAFVDADIKRLNFVYKYSVNPNKDKLFISSMERLIENYDPYEISTEVAYELASFYINRGRKYNSLNNETVQYKWDNKNAYELCKRAVENYPESKGGLKCTALISQIKNSHLTFQIEKVNLPDQKTPFLLSYKNIHKIHWKIISLTNEQLDELNATSWSRKELYNTIIKNGKVEKEEKNIYLNADNNFHAHKVEILLDAMTIGNFFLIVANNPEFTYEENILAFEFFKVSNIAYINRKKTNGGQDIYVMHRKTGEPLENIIVQSWSKEYNYQARKYKLTKDKKFTTNKDGYVEIKGVKNNVVLEFKKANDILMTENTFYTYGINYEAKQQKKITLFTDRAIYRPGQTVFYKGICIETDGKTSKIITNYKTDIRFKDANYQLITEEKRTTNDYGTFEGSFTIPTALLNGRMSLETEHGSVGFSVEEYKRPKFEVEILPFTSAKYRLKDSVEVKGKAISFAGSNLSNANVKYRVVRKALWKYWRPYYSQDEMEIEQGEIKTNANGQFNFKFKAIPDLSLPKSDDLSFNYQIIADVTDINGETQSTENNIIVGYTILNLDVKVPDEINREDKNKTFDVLTTNLNGEKIFAKGSIRVFKLGENETTLKQRLWEQPDEHIYTKGQWKAWMPKCVYKDEDKLENLKKLNRILTFSFDTEKPEASKLAFKEINKWESGRYILEIEARDEFGRDIKHKRYFTMFSPKDKTAPYQTINWFTAIKGSGEPKEKASFLIGSQEEVKVLYEIEHQGKIIKKEWINLKAKQKKIEIPILEKYRGNFSVHFTFVTQNRIYKNSHLVTVPYTNKELDIKFATFRNKLYPGSKEEWKIIIKAKKGEKATAEMLATLYDASLDQFAKNNWYFNIYNKYYTRLNWHNTAFATKHAKILKENFDKIITVQPETYPHLNMFGFHFYDYFNFEDKISYSMSVDSDEMMIEDGEIESIRGRADANIQLKKSKRSKGVLGLIGDVEKEVEPTLEKAETSKSGAVKIRKNFNETAFFYPNLETNNEGEIIIKFTIPEALTKWRMMGFAHTKDLKFSFVENELITQKELMLTPNAPRFFREFDEITFSTKIANVSEYELEGTSNLELFDAFTMKEIKNIFLKKEGKKFKIKAGESSEVSWKLKIPEGVQAITYRVVAQAGKFSDGEENIVPVLMNRILVTESMPIYANSNQTKTFEFTKLKNNTSKTLKNHQLTLELTSNPAWYAVQALPYLMEYPYECAEQTFSRFYANTLASHIVNSSPKIKQVYDSWRNTPKSKSLLSNLEKNQELKSLFLEETPWVLDSKDEGERKKRIALLFDLNRMSKELSSAVRKLKKQQTRNGAWAWFEGMPESRYITQHIVSGLGQLKHLKVEDKYNTSSMINKAVNFIDNELVKEYENLKKQLKNDKKKLSENNLSSMEIHYLYARSFFTDIKINKNTKEAFDYYFGQAKKYWLETNKYSQGMISLSLYRFDNKNEISQDIVKSLKETSAASEELGMYWKSNTGGYYWYQAPIETQALLISVFDEVAKDTKSVDDLKRWLLKQKQTQNWKTTKATVDAVYALLSTGGDWLDNSELAEVKLGTKIIDPTKMSNVKVEAGTGYFKTSFVREEVKKEMADVQLTKKGEGIAWGAVYWQYFEDLDKITPAKTPLKLEKKLFIEKVDKDGVKIAPITTNNELKIGDKIIVRITLSSDRDMEYLHLKDMRASGFEPINVISRYKYQDGLYYYETTKDASTNFFISYLRKGTYVFEYPLRVSHEGQFSNGITSIQCMYAPEFTSHSEGIKVKVKK